MRTSTIIPTRDTGELTIRCLASLESTEPPPDEIIVVDDGSSDDTVLRIEERFPLVSIVRNAEPEGFTAAANRGIAAAEGELLLLLNSDTEVPVETFRTLSDAFGRDPRLGIVGAELTYPDGSPQWSGGRRPTSLWLFALASQLGTMLSRVPGYRRARPLHRSGERIDWVTGAAMAIRTTAWKEVGPFDPRFAFYCQDLDLCLRARRVGWGVEILSGWRVLHHLGASIERIEPTSHQHQSVRLLWLDLLRWAEKEGGRRGCRRARLSLRCGGTLRRMALRLGLTASSGAGPERRANLLALEAALAAIDPADDESG